MLSGLRVVDLSDERGQFAGLLLAQLGADVIVVEPPGGSPVRRLGPFDSAGDSTVWAAWNRGKRAVEVDTATDAGRRRLDELFAVADVVIDACRPLRRDAQPVDLDHFAAVSFERGVLVTIAAFGLDGPKAGWAASDLTVWAAAGPLSLTGDRDRAPIRVPGGQAFLHAAGDAAVGAALALVERERSGRGQHVVVSAQRSAMLAAQCQMLSFPLGDERTERSSGGSTRSGVVNRFRYPALDGYVTITVSAGPSTGPFTARLAAAMHEAGECPTDLVSIDWMTLAAQMSSDAAAVERFVRFQDAVATFTARRTKAELFDLAVARRLLVAPVATMADIASSAQFADRGFWDDLGGVRAPGPWAHIQPIPLRRLRPAPGAATHQPTSAAPVATPSPTPSSQWLGRPSPSDGDGPLSGLRVLDFSCSMAGPVVTEYLAAAGATVVRVESSRRADLARGLRPFDRNDPEQTVSGAYNTFNAGKLGLALDMSIPAARQVAADLVAWADVVCNSFAPGAMARWDLDAATLRTRRPELITLSSSMMGCTGPLAGYAAFGNTGASLAGFTHVTGWPDRPPCGPYSAFTDYVSPRLAATALIAALARRAVTGEGADLDVSQAEAGVTFLAPLVIEHAATGRLPGAEGNRDPNHAPHGVHPAAGDDRWVAVACETDEQWSALAAVLGRPDLATLGGAERLSRAEELEGLVAGWTVSRPIGEIELTLQDAGVPVHGVQDSESCWHDPQLRHLRHFVPVPSPAGETWVEGPRVDLSRTPLRVTAAGPTIGEHAVDVLAGILGYEDERIAELFATGALE